MSPNRPDTEKHHNDRGEEVLLEIAEKHADGDFLRELGQFVLQRLMEVVAQGACGADLHERAPPRGRGPLA